MDTLDKELTQLISIHAPREGCDSRARKKMRDPLRFQSTHPVRGATSADYSIHPNDEDFNPRTP